MSVEDFTCAPEGIIYVYCCVDDVCRTIVSQPLRGRGFMPKLTDAEAVTMEIVGEFMGKDQDKGIWRYFRNHLCPAGTGTAGFPTWAHGPTSPNNVPTYGR